MNLKPFASLFVFVAIGLSPIGLCAAQNSDLSAAAQVEAYPNTPDGLKQLIKDILQSAKDKNPEKETPLIHSLLLPDNSTWFTDEYGPGFGSSLSAAYRKLAPGLDAEIKAVYEGNARRGWLSPKLLRYDNPDQVDFPIDHFLNSMNKIVPLYQTAFQGDRPMIFMSLKPGDNQDRAGGDLDGFFVYDEGSYRFIPMEVLMKLPSERPVRIKLDTNVMHSKLLTASHLRYPEEAIRDRIIGKVTVALTIDTAGKIKDMKVLQGNPVLAKAVIDDMKTWQFEPTTLDGDPVEVEVEWSIGFGSP